VQRGDRGLQLVRADRALRNGVIDQRNPLPEV
jgi:hypothetical protein